MCAKKAEQGSLHIKLTGTVLFSGHMLPKKRAGGEGVRTNDSRSGSVLAEHTAADITVGKTGLQE